MNIARLLETNLFFYRLAINKSSVVGDRLRGNRLADRMTNALVGDYKWSANSSDFNGWLICDGRELSRNSYPELFAIIGTSFGSTSSSTFKLPDCRGRTPCAIGHGDGLTNRQLGIYIGEELHTLLVEEMPTHTHTGTTSNSGAHTHDINDPGHIHTQTTINDDFNNSGLNPPGFSADNSGSQTWSNIDPNVTGITIVSSGLHNHTFTTAPTGESVPHNNMQPSVFLGSVFIYSGMLPDEVVILDNIREWTPFANTAYLDAFPDAYLYRFDGSSYGVSGYTTGIHYNINDGGDDMYDSGNHIWIEGDVIPEANLPSILTGSEKSCPYGTLYEKPDHSGGVYITSKNVYPHLTMTYAKTGTIKIRCFGNVGSDGDGSVTNFEGTYTCDNGRTGQYWANINYGTSDPSIGDVWFTITKPEWNTDITDTLDERKTEDADDYDHSVSVTGTNYVFCKVLLSRSAGNTIDAALVEKFLSNYVESMPQDMGFYNFDEEE